MGRRVPSTRLRYGLDWNSFKNCTGTGFTKGVENYIDLRLVWEVGYVGVQLFIGCARSRMAKKSIILLKERYLCLILP